MGKPGYLKSSYGFQRLKQILDRLDALEEREPRMVKIDALAARITALEARASMPVTASADSERPAVPRQPRPASVGQGAGGGKRLTDEQDRQIADMLKAGRSYSEIAASVDVSIGGLTKIKKRLAEQGVRGTSEQKMHFEFGWRLDTCSTRDHAGLWLVSVAKLTSKVRTFAADFCSKESPAEPMTGKPLQNLRVLQWLAELHFLFGCSPEPIFHGS